MNVRSLIFSFLLTIGYVSSKPGKSLAVSTTESPQEMKTTKDDVTRLPNIPEIYEMNISTNISNRFAKTLVTCKVRNTAAVAMKASFTVLLPKNAFISGFLMEIEGKSYKAFVKEKEEAKNIYDRAVAGGQTAAHVTATARDSNGFAVSINIEPELKAVFLLTYEELLQRKHDQYELVINIHPQQIVKELLVQVRVNESRPLKFVRTPFLRSGNEISKNYIKLDHLADIETNNSTTAAVTFKPDSKKQKEFAIGLGTKESEGISGQFIVQYDVERDPYGGEVLLQDGYFVHFFAPIDLQPMPQHVLFVLDSSTSMAGTKMEQLKDAMKSILKEIRIGDKVSIVEFNTVVNVWDINSGKATLVNNINYEDPFPTLSEQNFSKSTVFKGDTFEKSEQVIDNIYATGATNIIEALETALYLVKADHERSAGGDKHQPIILLLTDGDPTWGIRSTDEITDTVTRLNSVINISIFSLSFGNDANKNFLRNLSLRNKGFSRHIYEASDASLQLQNIYKQISSPLLSSVNFEYDSAVEEVTKRGFPIYFGGSELVVAGKYKDTTLTTVVKSVGPVGPVSLKPTIERPVTSLERLWAYLTVKQILEEINYADNKTQLTRRALDLALKYSFVTDVTSLVVVKPDQTTAVDTEVANQMTSHLPSRIYDKILLPVPDTFSVPSIVSGGRRGRARSRARAGVKFSSNFIAYQRGVTPEPIELGVLDDIHWLPSVLNPNGTITIMQKAYKLGTNYNAITQSNCTKPLTDDSRPSICVLLRDCDKMHFDLKTFKMYQEDYFCPVDKEYAGICCPK